MHINAGNIRRRRLSLTSLIDVIFLLLLFFMLSSTFSRFGDIELMTAAGRGQATPTELAFVQAHGTVLTLNGQSTTVEDLPSELARLQAEGRAEAVILSVTDDTTAQQLVDVVGIVQALNGMTLQIIR